MKSSPRTQTGIALIWIAILVGSFALVAMMAARTFSLGETGRQHQTMRKHSEAVEAAIIGFAREYKRLPDQTKASNPDAAFFTALQNQLPHTLRIAYLPDQDFIQPDRFTGNQSLCDLKYSWNQTSSLDNQAFVIYAEDIAYVDNKRPLETQQAAAAFNFDVGAVKAGTLGELASRTKSIQQYMVTAETMLNFDDTPYAGLSRLSIDNLRRRVGCSGNTGSLSLSIATTPAVNSSAALTFSAQGMRQEKAIASDASYFIWTVPANIAVGPSLTLHFESRRLPAAAYSDGRAENLVGLLTCTAADPALVDTVLPTNPLEITAKSIPKTASKQDQVTQGFADITLKLAGAECKGAGMPPSCIAGDSRCTTGSGGSGSGTDPTTPTPPSAGTCSLTSNASCYQAGVSYPPQSAVQDCTAVGSPTYIARQNTGGWAPSTSGVAALWYKVYPTTTTPYASWDQAQGFYLKGAQVWYQGKLYERTANCSFNGGAQFPEPNHLDGWKEVSHQAVGDCALWPKNNHTVSAPITVNGYSATVNLTTCGGHCGDWLPQTLYNKNDIVCYQQVAYKMDNQCWLDTAPLPPAQNSTYWTMHSGASCK